LVFQRQIFFNSLTVFLVAMLFLGVIFFSSKNLVYGKYTSIDVDAANDMITGSSYPNLIILDVRTQSEYDEGHLENAVLIPLTELESRIDEILPYKDTEIIVYCKVGGRSAQASSILDSNNFTKVFNVQGGITAWESAGYPIIHEFPSWIMPLLLAATLCVVIAVIVIIYRKRRKKPEDTI
jgi:rhodanese-related sulfurtransferase/cbb3-type cytochrome oxidase subunit 3